jgi:tRNA A-37 threonylcarbamoyl transferase component Bud32
VAPPVVYTKIICDEDLMPVGFLVMERIIGKYTSQTEVRQNAAEIHRLIDVLQTNKISHNDLHNRNILLGYTDSSPDPRVWIIDYGSARLEAAIAPEAQYRIAITFDGPNAHSSYKAFETV